MKFSTYAYEDIRIELIAMCGPKSYILRPQKLFSRRIFCVYEPSISGRAISSIFPIKCWLFECWLSDVVTLHFLYDLFYFVHRIDEHTTVLCLNFNALTGSLLDYGPFDYATVLQIDDLLILLCSSGHGKANEGYQCQDEKSFHLIKFLCLIASNPAGLLEKSVRLFNYLPGQEALECPCDE